MNTHELKAQTIKAYATWKQASYQNEQLTEQRMKELGLSWDNQEDVDAIVALSEQIEQETGTDVHALWRVYGQAADAYVQAMIAETEHHTGHDLEEMRTLLAENGNRIVYRERLLNIFGIEVRA